MNAPRAYPELVAPFNPTDGRPWTAEQVANFPHWAKVCYAIHPFNTRIRTYEQWCHIFDGTKVDAKQVAERVLAVGE